MKTIGSGIVLVYLPNGDKLEVEGEIEMVKERLIITEIVNINGKPAGARECNFPLDQCHIYWTPELYEEI